MRLTTMLIGAASLIGIGVYVGKKLIEKNENQNGDSVVYAKEKETYGEKFHKASMFAVGAVKTSADKLAEGFKEIKNNDMVKKGEETLEQAKEATEKIRKDIDDLKNMAVSINISVDKDGNETGNPEDAGNEPQNNDYMENQPSSFNDEMEQM